MNKNYGTIMATFNRLEKKGFVIKYGKKFLGIRITPWIFKLSEKGLRYINYGYR